MRIGRSLAETDSSARIPLLPAENCQTTDGMRRRHRLGDRLYDRPDSFEPEAAPHHRASIAPLGCFVASMDGPQRQANELSAAATRVVAGITHDRLDHRAPSAASQISSWRALYARGLGSFAQWLGKRYLLEKVEVEGLAMWQSAAQNADDRGLLILPTHTDLNRDPVVLLNLLRFASNTIERPQHASRKHLTASVVARQPKNWLESVVLRGIARPFVRLIATRAPGEFPLCDEQRQATRQTFDSLASDTMVRGEHVALFPQGTTYGTGDIEIRSTGGTRALSRYGDQKPVPLLPIGITYEALTTKRPRALVTLGRPLIVLASQEENSLHVVLREQLLQLNCITASGLCGALLLQGQKCAPLPLFTRADLCRLLAVLSDELGTIPNITVDRRLLDADRASFFAEVYGALQLRGYLDKSGTMRPLANIAEVHTRRGHVEYPLEFAGRRLLFQAALDAPLAAALETHLHRALRGMESLQVVS